MAVFGKSMSNKDLMLRLVADVKAWEEGMNKAGKSVGDLNKKVGENKSIVNEAMGMMAKYVSVAAAASAAMKVLSDAFMRSETNADRWGEAMQQSTAAYNTFLDTMSSGNWSNFFSNLETAIQGATDLYNALDRLGSVKANNAAAIAITNKQIAELRLEKQNTTDKARIQEIDKELNALSARLSALKAEGVEAQKEAAIKMSATEIQNRYNASGEGRKLSYESAEMIARKMIEGGQKFFDQQAARFADLQQQGTAERTTTVIDELGRAHYTTGQAFDLKNLDDKMQRQYLVAKVVTEAEAQLGEAINMYAGAINDSAQAAQEEYKNRSYALRKGMAERMAGSGEKGGAAGAVSALKPGADTSVVDVAAASFQTEVLVSALRPTEDAMAGLRKWFEENPPAPIEITVEAKNFDAIKNTANGIAGAFSSASAAIGQFSDESKAAAAAAKGFTIAGAVATLVAQFASIPKGAEIWSWIAGTIAGVGTLTAAVTSIKGLGYAEGGVVKGNHCTGDAVPIMANAGEIVLTASQQQNLASNLAGGGGGNQLVELELRGDRLVGLINNFGRGHGLGKIKWS